MKSLVGMLCVVTGTITAFSVPDYSNGCVVAAILIVGGLIITFMRGD